MRRFKEFADKYVKRVINNKVYTDTVEEIDRLDVNYTRETLNKHVNNLLKSAEWACNSDMLATTLMSNNKHNIAIRYISNNKTVTDKIEKDVSKLSEFEVSCMDLIKTSKEPELVELYTLYSNKLNSRIGYFDKVLISLDPEYCKRNKYYGTVVEELEEIESYRPLLISKREEESLEKFIEAKKSNAEINARVVANSRCVGLLIEGKPYNTSSLARYMVENNVLVLVNKNDPDIQIKLATKDGNQYINTVIYKGIRSRLEQIKDIDFINEISKETFESVRPSLAFFVIKDDKGRRQVRMTLKGKYPRILRKAEYMAEFGISRDQKENM